MMDIIVVCRLNPEHYKNLEMHRRIHSVYGISPTICTGAGGGGQPLILVSEDEPDNKTGHIA